MLQLQEYSMGWLVYFLSVFGLLLVTWRLFRGVPWWYLRGLLFVTVATFLVTPAIGAADYWAPVWIIGALEFLFEGQESAMPSIMIVLKVWGVVVVAFTVLSAISLLFRRESRPARKVASMGDTNATQKTPPRVL